MTTPTPVSTSTTPTPAPSAPDTSDKKKKKKEKKLFGKKKREEEHILEISGPTNFKHDSHIGWDAQKGFEVLMMCWLGVFSAERIIRVTESYSNLLFFIFLIF